MKESSSSLCIVDALYIYGILEHLKSRSIGVEKMNYRALKSLLDKVAETLNFRKPDKVIVVCAVDPNSDAQARFLEMLRGCGYLVHEVDYNRSYIFPASGAHLGPRHDEGVASVSTLIAYILGMFSSRTNPQVLVVSGCISLLDPLTDFAKNRNGIVALVFFRRFLDPQWLSRGLIEEDSPLRFYDLGKHAKELLNTEISMLDRKSPGIDLI